MTSPRNNTSPPTFVIAGSSSGTGKTTVTLGIMAAMRDRGLSVSPFKCGPDFIDPGLHQLATGSISRNLDPWMAGKDFCMQSFRRNSTGSDVAIIEGVMGMFDGGNSSSAALAKLLRVPLLLVLDIRSMAESAAALVHGFATLEPDLDICGVILNRVGSTRHLELARDSIQRHCDVPVLGHLPRDLHFSIPSRHLGLLTGDEKPISDSALAELSRSVEQYIDLDRLLAVGKTVSSPTHCNNHEPVTGPGTCRIGVARDQAFCFYYEDNFDILRSLGAELVFFSPLEARHLPRNLDGLYLGGGYPELYARKLSANRTMLQDIQSFVEARKPVYAECGGFMYLTKGIHDTENSFHRMVGIYPTTTRMHNRRASLGYRQVTTTADSFWGPAGTILRGHEFHYSTVERITGPVERIYNLADGREEGYRIANCLGGYMHLHFGYSPQCCTRFIQSCMES